MRNGKKTLLRGSFLLAVGAILASVSAALAWFSNHAEVDSRTTGSAVGSYFAYGSGTADDPFGLTLPRHVYNLAWLQDLGYFNQTDSSGKIQQYYFELASDIDMSTLSTAIPPVGTEEKPFVGHFTSRPKDGKSYTVSNLQVSNDFSSYAVHPSSVSGFGSALAQPHIVGFFGVVGEVNTTSPSDYSSSVLSISDFNLAGASVTSSVSDTLVGIAAGYVNGTLENVGVTSSSTTESTLSLNGSVSNYTTTTSKSFPHVSDYTLVGYAEDAYKDTVYRSVTNLSSPYVEDMTYVAGANGDSSGWGGSIDMETMYNHIKPLYENSTIYSYSSQTDVSVTFNSSGDPVTSVKTTATTESSYRVSWPQDNSEGYDAYNSETDGSNVTAKYSFVKRKNSRGNTNSTFLYLSGASSHMVAGSQTKNVTLKSTPNGTAPKTISDGSGHYLALGPSGLTNSASSSSLDTSWYIENGTIFTYDPYHDFVKTYLYDNNGTLSTSTASSTTWTYSATAGTISSNQRYLCYLNGIWLLSSKVSVTQYTISYYSSWGSTYYLSVSNGSLSRASNSSSAARFYVDAYGYYYTMVNGNVSYLTLVAPSSSDSDFTHVSLSSTISTAAFKKDGNYLTADYDGTTWYLYQYRGAYAYSDDGTSYTFRSTNVSVDRTLSFAEKTKYTASGADATYTTGDTYFPLNFDSSSTSKVSDKNTGYVISGAYEGSGIGADIRVSQYSLSDLSNSTNGTSIVSSKVYTIDSARSHTISDASSYEKFTTSLNSLNSVISSSSDSYIYGLHFMDANLSKDHLITADYVSVNGTSHTNYELPEDSIDFHLKEKGYINFLAGTYFSGNDSFFSLHRIFRDASDETKIQDIKEIQGVYQYTGTDKTGKAYSYVYQYSDGNYSAPYWFRTLNGERKKCAIGTTTSLTDEEIDAVTTSVPSGYTMVFDTAWIKKQDSLTTDAAYYFEIPMNDGEFALGSVSGGTGAYLMYLDIGGNASTVDRTKISEKITTTTSQYSVPKGIALLAKAGDVVKNMDSACVQVSSGYTGTTLRLKRETDTNTKKDEVTLEGYDQNTCAPSYAKLGMSVQDASGNTLPLTPVASTTKTAYRLTLIDYSENLAEYTKTVLVKDEDSYTAKVYDQNGNELTDRSAYPIYSDKGLQVDESDYSSLFDSMVSNAATYFTGNNLSFAYEDSKEGSFTFDYVIAVTSMDNETGKMFYQISSYTIQVTNGTDDSKSVILTVQEGPSNNVLLKRLDEDAASATTWTFSFLLNHDGSTDTLAGDSEIVLNP